MLHNCQIAVLVGILVYGLSAYRICPFVSLSLYLLTKFVERDGEQVRQAWLG